MEAKYARKSWRYWIKHWIKDSLDCKLETHSSIQGHRCENFTFSSNMAHHRSFYSKVFQCTNWIVS